MSRTYKHNEVYLNPKHSPEPNIEYMNDAVDPYLLFPRNYPEAKGYTITYATYYPFWEHQPYYQICQEILLLHTDL